MVPGLLDCLWIVGKKGHWDTDVCGPKSLISLGDEMRRRKVKGRKETDKGEGRKHERGGGGEEEGKKKRGK